MFKFAGAMVVGLFFASDDPYLYDVILLFKTSSEKSFSSRVSFISKCSIHISRDPSRIVCIISGTRPSVTWK